MSAWERTDDDSDYCPSDECVALWRTLLLKSDGGWELYGYAEQTAEGWKLDLGGRIETVLTRLEQPPRGWRNALLDWFGLPREEAR